MIVLCQHNVTHQIHTAVDGIISIFPQFDRPYIVASKDEKGGIETAITK